ncbi:MAG: response regulator, partial [Saprospiraceae bacterium]|nr:response regulator [Saprospiraceae bacterium]
EKLASARLIRMLNELNPQIEVVANLSSLEEAQQFFAQNKHSQADILFFDIQLGDGTSFELFDRFKFESPVIFTTAYDQFALPAIKVRASDYLLKPIKMEELDQAIKHVIELAVHKLETTPEKQDEPPETYFRLNRRLIVHLKAIDDMQVYSKSRIKINLKPVLDEEILVSTEKAGSFKRWLGGTIPGME